MYKLIIIHNNKNYNMIYYTGPAPIHIKYFMRFLFYFVLFCSADPSRPCHKVSHLADPPPPPGALHITPILKNYIGFQSNNASITNCVFLYI